MYGDRDKQDCRAFRFTCKLDWSPKAHLAVDLLGAKADSQGK